MNISEITKTILHLNLIKGLGSSTISKITNLYQDSDFLKKIYNFSIFDLKTLGFSESLSKLIFFGLKDFSILEKELSFLKKNKNYYVISPFDSNYPVNLKNLENFPPILYIESFLPQNFSNNEIYFSCIGSRKSNFYSEKAFNYFLEKISNEKIVIVSGGAIGGDSIAHLAAIKNNLKTIAILGSGLEKKYPKENLKLFNKILENNGALISQFTFQTEPSKFSFPQRNMIIAGFSKSLFVSQANKKSGTLITAQAALEFGRSVGVLPGRFDEELSYGCNYLIKEGASLIGDEEDLFDLLQIKNKNSNKNLTEKIKIISIENQIIEFCFQGKRFEEIKKEFEKNFNNESEIKKFLFELQLKNLLNEDFMGIWKKNF